MTVLRLKVTHKFLIAIICMLCTSSALAMSYSIVKDSGNMCQSVRQAFAKGMVLDAERPLCERRFVLSPEASTLGLSNVDKKLLPRSAYPNLLRKIIAVTVGEKGLQSAATRNRDAAAIDRLMKWGVKLYSSNFDADNSEKSRTVYIADLTFCAIKNNYPDGSVSTYISDNNGTLDPSWGARDATNGIPFIYKGHTYYMRWKSLRGGPDKNVLAEIDIFDASPYRGVFAENSPYNVLLPLYCVIYQTRKRMRP